MTEYQRFISLTDRFFLLFWFCVSVLMVTAAYLYFDERNDRQEYRQVCIAAGGRPAWDGLQLQCFHKPEKMQPGVDRGKVT